MYVYVRLCLLACTCIYLTLLDACTYKAMYFSHVIKKLTHAQNIPFGVLYILYLFINIGLVLHARWWCLCTRHWRQCSSKRFGLLRYTRRVWNGQFVLCDVIYMYLIELTALKPYRVFMYQLWCRLNCNCIITQRLYDSMMCYTKYCHNYCILLCFGWMLMLALQG